MGVDDMDEAQASEAAAEPKQEAKDGARFGAWVDGDGADADMDADMEEGEEEAEDKDEVLIHEKAIGKGMILGRPKHQAMHNKVSIECMSLKGSRQC